MLGVAAGVVVAGVAVVVVVVMFVCLFGSLIVC